MNLPESPRRPPIPLLLSAALAATCLVGAKVETWKQDTSSAFARGKRERVVVSEGGRVRLGRAVKPTAPIDAVRVWDLARAGDGTVYAATGDAGKVFARKGDDEPWSVAYDAEDSQALALAVAPGGQVFLGTGPTGEVVELTDPKHPSSRPDPAVKYIWDLAADKDGNLFAATGPTGQLWRRSPAGAWTLLLDSRHPHLLSVAVAPDGTAFAGSDGEGLLYKVTPEGAVSVLLDAPQTEVRALLIAPDGTLFAGTAQEGGGRAAPAKPVALASRSREIKAVTSADDEEKADDEKADDDDPLDEPAPAPVATSRRVRAAAEGKVPLKAQDFPPIGGTAVPKATTAGENAVYRIGHGAGAGAGADTDAIPREVFRAKALVYALAWRDGRLLVGTGPDGQLFEVRDDGSDASPIARVDNGQILALLLGPKGEVLVGAGDPGAVSTLAPGVAAAGTITSEVLDAKLPSRFGAISWKSETPAGTSLSVQVRSGNVGEPDETWSPWSPPLADPEGAGIPSPPGRFLQYRANLATTVPDASPELRSISLCYQSTNLPPEITRIEVPDLPENEGAARPAKVTLKWDVTDPNGDDLSYRLHLRKDGWPDWVPLGDGPITEKSYAWDTAAVPGGTYRLRLSATDRPSNNPAEAHTRDRESEPFVIDHLAPTVAIAVAPGEKAKGKGKGPGAVSVVTLKDDQTRLVKAAYSLDGGPWVAAFPADGLFDAKAETLRLDMPGLAPGFHVLMVRATDAAGNTGTGDAVLSGP